MFRDESGSQRRHRRHGLIQSGPLGRAARAQPVALRDGQQRRIEAEHMEAEVAAVAEDHRLGIVQPVASVARDRVGVVAVEE